MYKYFSSAGKVFLNTSKASPAPERYQISNSSPAPEKYLNTLNIGKLKFYVTTDSSYLLNFDPKL